MSSLATDFGLCGVFFFFFFYSSIADFDFCVFYFYFILFFLDIVYIVLMNV